MPAKFGNAPAGSPEAKELGQLSKIARDRKQRAIRRLCNATRASQGLSPAVRDVDVLERLADLFEAEVAEQLAS